MSRYTIEVRTICEYFAGESGGFNSIEDILDASVDDIFNFEFEFYDESRRTAFEKLILRNFYTREICEETFGLWQLRLENKLNQIMPYYNLLYKSALLDFNPFYDTDLNSYDNKSEKGVSNSSREMSDSEIRNGREKESGRNSGISSEIDKEKNSGNRVNVSNGEKENSFNGVNSEVGTEHSEKDNLDKYADTPQGQISNLAFEGDSGYLTNARKIDEDVDSNRSSNGVVVNNEKGKETLSQTENAVNDRYNEKQGINSENRDIDRDILNNKFGVENEKNKREDESIMSYAKKVIGKKGGASYSKMLLEFRNTFMRIDEMVLNELSVLFFSLWE